MLLWLLMLKVRCFLHHCVLNRGTEHPNQALSRGDSRCQMVGRLHLKMHDVARSVALQVLTLVTLSSAMGVQEVVRGEDLLTSTARQLLLYESLQWQPPTWCHTPLVCNAQGHRLAKRADGLSIRELRQAGMSPEQVLAIRQMP